MPRVYYFMPTLLLIKTKGQKTDLRFERCIAIGFQKSNYNKRYIELYIFMNGSLFSTAHTKS